MGNKSTQKRLDAEAEIRARVATEETLGIALTAQIGGDTTATFAFTDQNEVTDDDTVYAALDALDVAQAARVDHGASVAIAQLIFSGQPSATETITIGADVYEWNGAFANINVTIGGTAELSIDALVIAINSSGTESVLADKLGTTYCRIRSADAPGGTVLAADPSIVLGEASTSVIWDVGNVNMNTLAGVAAGGRSYAAVAFTATSEMIDTSSEMRLDFPFTVTFFTVQVRSSTGAPRAATGDLFTLDNDGIKIAFATGAPPNIQATDLVTIVAYA